MSLSIGNAHQELNQLVLIRSLRNVGHSFHPKMKKEDYTRNNQKVRAVHPYSTIGALEHSCTRKEIIQDFHWELFDHLP